jgi:hypothetical protein
MVDKTAGSWADWKAVDLVVQSVSQLVAMMDWNLAERLDRCWVEKMGSKWAAWTVGQMELKTVHRSVDWTVDETVESWVERLVDQWDWRSAGTSEGYWDCWMVDWKGFSLAE